MSDSGPTNRLIDESSPYLLQHARNPVDWFPWGPAAFEQARIADKPVFLSIGYSACHWCHVMERESFESDEIARVLNAGFVSIKVDREERPDVDAIYMNAVVAMTGHGGWPMSVFLTPDQRPFFGGTYWPPRARAGMPGFLDVLRHIQAAWHNRREEVLHAAGDMTNALAAMGEPTGPPQPLGVDVLKSAADQLLRAADRTHGGFGRAPKFPHAMDVRVLLRAAARFDNREALAVAALTLEKMARGGLYDQLGGGFHRYSTDALWLAPHFEKMLYDQALLVPAYLEAFQATGRDELGRIARETLDYVAREMTDSAGGFYSTQDADSEGEEGKFFVWTVPEVERILGPDAARTFCDAYDVTPAGNWEGHNILRRLNPDAPLLETDRQTLFDARSKRIAPARDEKMLAGWNGMMIAAFAQAAAVLDQPKYAEQAARAADFVLTKMMDGGRLLHTCKDGVAKLPAYLDDYASLADGLTELYQATADVRWLDAAVRLADEMTTHFADPAGGYFYTADDHETLIVRQRDSQDNATPSGNSLAATVLLKLARLTGRTAFEDRAIATLDAISEQIRRVPMASGQALIALDFLFGPTREIVLAGDEPFLNDLRRAVYAPFIPNKVVLTRPPATEDDDLPELLESLLVGKTASDGGAVAYICEQGVCHAPTSTPEGVRAALERPRIV